ncbi:Protein unc-80 [Dirofilaria immitis]
MICEFSDKTEESLLHTEERECRNESLQLELRKLNDERNSLYENCLREKSRNIATTVENAKKKAKCKMNNAQQKLYFREARKLKNCCGQLFKCCAIRKLCKISTIINEKIATKRREIREADEQCYLERYDSIKAKNARNYKRG